jgi:transcription elongation factor Elf1
MKAKVQLAPLDFPVIRFRCGCGSTLTLSLEMMAKNTPAVCDGCSARLRVDAKSGSKKVEALMNAMAKLQRVRRAIS